MDAGLPAAELAGLGLRIMGVSAVDYNISRLQIGEQAVQHIVHRLAGLDHDQDLAGLFQNGAQGLIGGTAGDREAQSLALGGKSGGQLRLQIVPRHGKTVLSQVQSQTTAHDSQTNNTELVL